MGYKRAAHEFFKLNLSNHKICYLLTPHKLTLWKPLSETCQIDNLRVNFKIGVDASNTMS